MHRRILLHNSVFVFVLASALLPAATKLLSQTAPASAELRIGGDVSTPLVLTVADLKASGMWEVVTPDQCVELARRYGSVVLHPLMGGMPPELGWESLQLYVDKVLPRL